LTQTEEALRTSEKWFRQMADQAPVMIWISATDKLCTWFNKPWLEFTGRTMDEELGNGWAAGVHPDDLCPCLKVYHSSFDSREPFRMEYRLRRHDGEYRWILNNGIPLRGRTGEFAGYIGSCIDLTERKRAEGALRDREDRLEAILDTVSDAIITIDRNGTIQSVNRATEQMFGYNAAELIGQNVRLLMPSPYREAHDGYIANYVRTGQKHIIGISREVEAQRKDGTIFPADLAVSEIEHLGLFTGIHRDLTERKRLEREVVEVASLEQRRIGENLHDSVAQELAALNLLVKDLADTVRNDPDGASQLLGRIGQGLQRCQQDLRAVLRGLLPVAIDRQGLMDALADLADRTRREGGVHCRFDSPQPVDVADNVTATHLFLIAQEAVHNALKHGKPRNITISLEANHHLTLRIECDGIGMPPEAEMTRGLGLRVMRNRAAIIGATLTIVPAEPRGTLVTCQLVRKIDEPD
jgi:PAS domain S-box-containing protein